MVSEPDEENRVSHYLLFYKSVSHFTCVFVQDMAIAWAHGSRSLSAIPPFRVFEPSRLCRYTATLEILSKHPNLK